MQPAAARIMQDANSGCYKPEAYGARCDRCILSRLRQGGPVPPELNPGATIMVAAEAPGADEVDLGRPLIGKSGQETMKGLAAIGINRGDVSWSNAFLCRPPGNDLDRLLLRLKKENKARAERGEEPLLSPIEACRPRFISELRLHKEVIALGKVSVQSITQTNRSIMDMRGMPLDGKLDGSGRFHTTAFFPTPGELVTPLRVVPTVHPAFVLRQARWRKIFRVDLSRAVRWFRGQLSWKEPQKLFTPSPDQLEYFLLKHKHPFMVYDVETDAKECLVAKLRCIGFATPEAGLVVPFLGIDGVTRFYTSDQEEAVRAIVAEHYTRADILKVGHNAGYYDRIVVEEQLGVTPKPLVDTILLHRGVESELPHNLGFVGSVYTDVMDAWKAAHTATTAQSDQDLWDYCLVDCVVTARATPPMYTLVQQRGLLPAVEVHHRIQEVCAGLHRVGMYVDQQRRKDHDASLKKEAATQRQVLRNIIGDADFNPNSRAQVAQILFDRWGLTPDVIYASAPDAGKKLRKAYTSSGEPSTGDDHLRAMLLYTKKSEQKEFLVALRKFRGAAKLRGTNVIPLRPSDEPYFETDDLAINLDDENDARAIDEYDESKAVKAAEDGKHNRRAKRPKQKKPGLVMGDLRVHPHYNAHATTSQRLSSSEPNGQNWSRKIRDMVCAQATWEQVMNASPSKPARALLAADMDQLELRFAAALAGAVRYLEVFATGGDPHAVTCEMLYGSAFTNASEGDKKRLRDFAKRFSYAVLYRATVETVHETLASSENDAGELVFPWLTLRETRTYFEKWIAANPEIEGWWDRDLAEFRRQGYLIEPVLGWRRDFLDGEDPNEIANFKCQAGGSAIVHIGTLEFLKYVPFERWGPGTGLIQQGHDALMVEVPATHPPHELKRKKDGSLELDKYGMPKIAKWCPKGCKCVTEEHRQLLQDCMTIDGRPYGLPVKFTASGKTGYRWSEV